MAYAFSYIRIPRSTYFSIFVDGANNIGGPRNEIYPVDGLV